MQKRVTLSVDHMVADYLSQRAAIETAGNVSAYVDRHFRDLALAASASQEALWYQQHPYYLLDAEAERYESGAL